MQRVGTDRTVLVLCFHTPLSVDGCLPLASHLHVLFLVGVDRAVRRRFGDAEQDKASTDLRFI